MGAVLRCLLALVVAVVFGVPSSLLCAPLTWFQGHIVRTLLYLMPSSPFRGMFAIWVAHTLDGVCWRCGARPPSVRDFHHGGRRP
jgi:hypothetical protein